MRTALFRFTLLTFLGMLIWNYGTPYFFAGYSCRDNGYRTCLAYDVCNYFGIQGIRQFWPGDYPVGSGNVCGAVKFYHLRHPLF